MRIALLSAALLSGLYYFANWQYSMARDAGDEIPDPAPKVRMVAQSPSAPPPAVCTVAQ
jgi:hypothetical protein